MGEWVLPKLYAIVDSGVLQQRGLELRAFVEELRDAGVRLVQYRDKVGSPQEVLRAAALISEVFAGTDAMLVMNDRADLARLGQWNAVHVGQGDLSPEDARKVLASGRAVVGVSTHTEAQVRAANTSVADYVAIGPVFATSTKKDAEPVVGLEGLRRARALSHKPLVAIGGITRENASSVMDAGADSVAVISGLLVEGERVRKVAEDFLRILG
jgi:thiamine-phosphate pyrophosphorylase